MQPTLNLTSAALLLIMIFAEMLASQGQLFYAFHWFPVAMSPHVKSFIDYVPTLRAKKGLCQGKRLDSTGTFSPSNFIPASWCSSMGGDCCNLSPEWGFVSNDPDAMDPKAGCYGCYDTTTPVNCSGDVLMSMKRTEEEEETGLTAGECLQSGGQCCSPHLANEFDDGFVFDPRLFLKNEMCSNCFEGPIQLNITTKRVECDGRLLKSSEPKSNVCSMLNGHCCEGVFGTFDPLDFPRMDCFVCYSGFVQQI